MATSATCKSQPKRVILRLRVNQFEGSGTSEYDDAIKAYLTFAKRPTSEFQANKHYAHIEPFQDPEIRQTSFHIILDIEKDMLEDLNLQNLPHEIYLIRRDDQGILQVKPIQNALEKKISLSKRAGSLTAVTPGLGDKYFTEAGEEAGEEAEQHKNTNRMVGMTTTRGGTGPIKGRGSAALKLKLGSRLDGEDAEFGNIWNLRTTVK